MNTNTDLNGKRVLVTGGTKGIGEAIVNRLRSEGAEVATVARTIPEGIGFPEMLIRADLSTTEGIEHIAVEAQKLLGGVDILINNVGGSSAPSGGALALTDADWQLALDQNLFAAGADGFAWRNPHGSPRPARRGRRTCHVSCIEPCFLHNRSRICG